MKRVVLGVLAAAVAWVIIGCGEPFLLYESTLPEFKPPADKALCVIIRPSQTGTAVLGRLFVGGSFDANALAKVYLDGKLIAGLTGNSVTSFDVEAGEHLVLSKVKTMSKVKYNFQAGKVYYITQALIPIPFVGTGQVMKPMTPDEYKAKLADNNGPLQYTRLNPTVPVENMDPKDVADEQKDYQKWAANSKNAADAKIEADYPGY
jgi:hypothetical protein